MGSIVAEIADKIASAGGGERSELEVRGGIGAAGGGILTLSTSEATVVDADILGRIDFQAPVHDGTGDALLVGASIYAEADDTFAADNNSTELVFAVGASEAAAEKMRLTHDGELGIGVATPASLLHVAGTVQVGVDDTGHDVKFFGATSGAYMLWDESTDDLILGGAARLGIGTTAPAKLVHIVGAADNALLEGLQLDNTDHASTETGQAIAINMRLSKAGTMRDAGRITVGKDDDWDDAGASDSHLTFKTNLSDTLTEHMRITSAGNVGIGESSNIDSRLSVAPTTAISNLETTIIQVGGIKADDAVDTKSGIGFGYSSTSRPISPATIGYETKTTSGGTYGDLYFATRSVTTNTAPTERMRITSAGSITVPGTSTPNFHTTLASNQSISNTSWTKALFATEAWDHGGNFASNKFTVPAGGAGKYHFHIFGIMTDFADGLYMMTRFWKNGSTLDKSSKSQSAKAGTDLFIHNTMTITLAATDYIEAYVYQNSGGAKDFRADYAFFSGHRMIGL